MGWRMKNFNIFSVHGKVWVLGRGIHEKPIYRGDCLKITCYTSPSVGWGCCSNVYSYWYVRNVSVDV